MGQVTLPLAMSGKAVSVDLELRSVNSRFLECLLKTPLSALHERSVQMQVAKVVGRGRVEIRLAIHQDKAGASSRPIADDDRMRALFEDLQLIEQSARTQGVSLGAISALEIYRTLQSPSGQLGPTSPSEVLDALWRDPETRKDLDGALQQALDQLVSMRDTEGACLAEQIRQEAQGIASCLVQVEGVRQAMGPQIQARMQERIAQLLGGPESDRVQEVGQARIAQEIAVLLARADVQEELVRIAAHLRQVDEILDEASNVGQGKRLNFLCQELGREWTTVGAKLADPAAGKIIVTAKSHIERIREQAQNVE